MSRVELEVGDAGRTGEYRPGLDMLGWRTTIASASHAAQGHVPRHVGKDVSHVRDKVVSLSLSITIYEAI